MKIKTAFSLLTAAVLTALSSAADDFEGQSEFLPDVSTTDAYVLETVTPKYPQELLQRGVQGKAMLMLRVDESGEVSDVRVLASTNKLFSQAAEESVRNWYFQPGTREGVPVPQLVTVPVEFQIEDLQIPSIVSL